MDERTVARFWSKVDKRGPDECWPWTAGLFDGGYGSFWVGGTSKGSHRVAWEATFGPTDLHVLHSCDNPPCCNPSHLFTGSNLDNIADKVAKGRQARQKGSTHGMSKLTEAAVVAIRDRMNEPADAVGRDFGIDGDYVNAIRRGKAWKHVPGARGNIHPRLTEETVRLIRSSSKPQRMLARELGVSQTAVFFARSGRTWRHVA